mmetsp:Transcript_19912/g.48438  ORF Transcript_19912/g.48438 Transcript_19912/m.48438 type:complete len:258 (+) Transcript_19912:448-1221(+)
MQCGMHHVLADESFEVALGVSRAPVCRWSVQGVAHGEARGMRSSQSLQLFFAENVCLCLVGIQQGNLCLVRGISQNCLGHLQHRSDPRPTRHHGDLACLVQLPSGLELPLPLIFVGTPRTTELDALPLLELKQVPGQLASVCKLAGGPVSEFHSAGQVGLHNKVHVALLVVDCTWGVLTFNLLGAGFFILGAIPLPRCGARDIRTEHLDMLANRQTKHLATRQCKAQSDGVRGYHRTLDNLQSLPLPVKKRGLFART